ncbi:MAG: T9SS type A sorting domain-containing protein, partial [Bacteroidota bacterium]
IEPLDNQDIIMQTVTGSYDPNDKQVLSSQSLSPQMVLDQVPIDYLIRFQNTGTDTAFTVIITDSMSQQLDWSTFQMVDASHSYRLQISEEGLFSWRFDNILLPDSNTNEAESHGFVRFRVSPQADLIVGDTIRNKAAIYFDYNAPIITNTSKTPVSFNSSNEALSLSNFQFRLMPNPSHGVVQVSISAPGYAEGEISVIDILGKTVLRESVRLQNGQFKQHFNWRSLPNGYYLVQMDFGGERVIQKWIKQ